MSEPKTTKIYVKSQRSFFIHADQIISGGREDDQGKFTGYIDPDTIVELTEKEAKRLKDLYPTEIMDLDKLAHREPKKASEAPKAVGPAAE